MSMEEAMKEFPMNPPVNDGITEKIRKNAEIIADEIRNGNEVWIRSCKDGIKIQKISIKSL